MTERAPVSVFSGVRLSDCEGFLTGNGMIGDERPREEEGFPIGTVRVATESALTSLVISLLWAESL